MTQYMFVCARDLFESANEVGDTFKIAADLLASGNGVTVFLLQNGVFAAGAKAKAPELQELINTGVRVLADDFSLRERAITGGELRAGVEIAPIECVVDALANGVRTLWY
ncbi:DsrE family protein [Tepidicaulis sp. LMO-SS28]|uniref:DsrE family protein n=1 Tax=Tepidicaulis sp. LMO-SS28 TaxID=3447455 RepID=UPI003EE333ED